MSRLLVLAALSVFSTAALASVPEIDGGGIPLALALAGSVAALVRERKSKK